MAWKGDDGDLYLFGGLTQCLGQEESGDLWRYDPPTHEWTWLSGSSDCYQAAVYGTKGVPSPDNVPGSRKDGVCWSGKNGTLYLFGGTFLNPQDGFGYGRNDVWEYSISTNEWTWVGGTDGSNQPGVYGTQGIPSPGNSPGERIEALVLKSSAGQVFLFGGHGFDEMGSVAALDDLWSYDLDSGEWTWIRGAKRVHDMGVYDGTSPFPMGPGGRRYASLWNVDADSVYLFSGSGHPNWLGPAGGGDLCDLWKYIPAGNRWTFLKGNIDYSWKSHWGEKGVPDPANTPHSRYGAASWTSADHNTLYLFGGFTGHSPIFESVRSGPQNDLWGYDIASNTWTWLTGGQYTYSPSVYGVQGVPAADNTPGGRKFPACWTREDGTLYLFGGYGSDGNPDPRYEQQGPLDDLWRYDPATNQWTWVNGDTSVEVPAVYGTRGVADPANTPGGRFATAFWTGKDQAFYLFGGSRIVRVDSQPTNWVDLNDLWKYDPATNEWTWLTGSDVPNQPGVYGERGHASAANTPGARMSAAGWTGSDGDLYLFGGHTTDSSTTNTFNDLWKYDPGTNEWTWLQGSSTADQPGVLGEPDVFDAANTPGARYGAVGWEGSLGHTVYIFGGFGYDVEGYQDNVADIWRGKQLSMLQVTIHPDAALNTGAQWRRVGTTTWHNSGDYESDLPNGSYTVEFKTLSTLEWSTPPDQTVLVFGLETTSVDGVYVNTYKRLRVVKALLGLSRDTSGLDDNQNGEIDAGDLETLMRLGE